MTTPREKEVQGVMDAKTVEEALTRIDALRNASYKAGWRQGYARGFEGGVKACGGEMIRTNKEPV